MGTGAGKLYVGVNYEELPAATSSRLDRSAGSTGGKEGRVRDIERIVVGTGMPDTRCGFM